MFCSCPLREYAENKISVTVREDDMGIYRFCGFLVRIKRDYPVASEEDAREQEGG
jgi:hypothetical protein